eukprot:215103_1
MDTKLFLGQLKALLKIHWLNTIRRPVGTILLICLPACFILSGLFTGHVRGRFPTFFPYFFIGTFVRLFGDIVEEKEKRIKEGMKMMGLQEFVFVLSNFIAESIRFLLLSFFYSALAILALYPDGNFWNLPLFFFLFQLSLFGMAYLLGAFVHKTRHGAFFGILVFILSLLVGSFAENSESSRKYFFLALPPHTFHVGLRSFFQSASAANQTQRVTAPLDIGVVLAFLFFDAALFFFFGIYLAKVLPSPDGARKNWDFIFDCCRNCPEKGDAGAVVSEGRRERSQSFESVYKESPNARVTVRGLTRTFSGSDGKDIRAVDGMFLDIYDGEVLSLLGHNGAGKTTTVKMLTGLLPATSGDAFIDGISIRSDIHSVRRRLGVCPQYDILFPALTVEEHLRLFGRIKGVPSDRLETEISRLIAHIGLTDQTHQASAGLSGGEKRKLSLCMAFIGGPRIVFLDEPTAGMDALSRRAAWDLIKRNKRGRCIILTTHFMDEADYLGDSIAIMSEGRVRCCGSSLFLKARYGEGYTLTVTQPTSAEQLANIICAHVDEASLKRVAAGEVVYTLPAHKTRDFPALFDSLDILKNASDIQSYAVSPTTLEEVFLHLVNQKDKQVDSESSSSNCIEIEDSNSLLCESHLENGERLFVSHVSSLLAKRLAMSLHSKPTLFLEIILPALFLGCFCCSYVPIDWSSTLHRVQLEFNLPPILSLFLSMPLLTISWTSMNERVVKAKHLQAVSGVSSAAFWTANFVWDFMLMLVPALFIFPIFLWFDLGIFFDRHHFFCSLLSIIMFCASSVPVAYVASFMFNRTVTLAIGFTLINLVSFAFAMLKYSLGDYNNAVTQTSSWEYLTMLFPLNTFISSFAFNVIRAQGMSDRPSVWSWHRSGKALTFLALDFILYSAVVMLIDHILSTPRLLTFFENCFCDKKFQSRSELEDKDVKRERERIRGGKSNDLIQVKGLRREFNSAFNPTKVAVENLTFGVPEAQIFGFLGVNGAGKSSTLKMLTGDLVPTSGSASLNGFSILNEQTSLRRCIGYCPQSDALIRNLSPREHLKLFAGIRNVPRTKIPELISELIDRIGLSRFANKAVKHLSYGNRRKLSVAIALIGCPKICFLDEPSSGMDPESKRLVWNLVAKTMENRAVILTTHSMEECEALCQRVSIMVSGQMRCIGSLPHLKSKYGKGYMVDLSIPVDKKNIANLDEFMKSNFPGSKLFEQHGLTFSYSIPKAGLSLGSVFRILETPPPSVVLVNYRVSEVSIEQIFNRMANTKSSDDDEVQLIQSSSGEEGACRACPGQEAGKREEAVRSKIPGAERVDQPKKSSLITRRCFVRSPIFMLVSFITLVTILFIYSMLRVPLCDRTKLQNIDVSLNYARYFEASPSSHTFHCQSGFGTRSGHSVSESAVTTCQRRANSGRIDWSDARGCFRRCAVPSHASLDTPKYTLLAGHDVPARFVCSDSNLAFGGDINIKSMITFCTPSGEWDTVIPECAMPAVTISSTRECEPLVDTDDIENIVNISDAHYYDVRHMLQTFGFSKRIGKHEFTCAHPHMRGIFECRRDGNSDPFWKLDTPCNKDPVPEITYDEWLDQSVTNLSECTKQNSMEYQADFRYFARLYFAGQASFSFGLSGLSIDEVKLNGLLQQTGLSPDCVKIGINEGVAVSIAHCKVRGAVVYFSRSYDDLLKLHECVLSYTKKKRVSRN